MFILTKNDDLITLHDLTITTAAWDKGLFILSSTEKHHATGHPGTEVEIARSRDRAFLQQVILKIASCIEEGINLIRMKDLLTEGQEEPESQEEPEV